MTRLAAQGLSVDLQILDNKASVAYKHAITFTWQAKFQLVPPDMRCRNRTEQAIRTFKAHFLYIFAGVDPTFPRTFGTSSFPRLSSPSISFDSLLSTTGSLRRNTSKGLLISTRSCLVRFDVACSYMHSLPPGAHGTFVPGKISILVWPWTHIAASN